MKEKNFARDWMGIILALGGLVIAIPASYMFQGPLTQYFVSFPDYLRHLPDLFGQIDRHDTGLISMRNTLIYTAMGFAGGGFVLGALIKLIIKAARPGEVSTKAP